MVKIQSKRYIMNMSTPVRRLLKPPSRSFFLFGPRCVGKSTWLKDNLKDAVYIDLLNGSLCLELSHDPHKLEALIGERGAESWIILDEIQKVPLLLDEVHRLIEEKGWRFALCGSSARKLRRSGTNLLGGRAITRILEPFSSQELGNTFDLESAIQWGMLPIVHSDRDNAADILSSYVNTFIKEEIKEESIVRSLPPFVRFLNVCGLMNGQIINSQNIAREASVPRSSVDVYFSIMTDTYLGNFLPSYRPNLKVREQAHPKFYWFDPGTARAAAGLLFDPLDASWKGIALETIIFHELRVYNQTNNKNRDIYYYRTAAGVEIDFVIETQKKQKYTPAHVVCIEIKSSKKWNRKWERPLWRFAESDAIVVDKMICVYTGENSYKFDNLLVLPVIEFLKSLYSGNIF